jgi:outer membrane murein-binding lipoprotein Lpp
MRVLFCALAIVLMGLSGPLVAAQPTNQELSKRVADLQRRVERLEHREKAETQAEKKAAKAKPK